MFHLATRSFAFVLYCVIIALQASNKKKKEQEKHQIVIDKLKEEKRKQTENHKMIMVRVSSEQDEWFNTSE